MKELVSVNGEIYKPEDAKISVFDRGFLYGDAIYEVTRSYGKVLAHLELHIDRLYRSADRLAMPLPWSKEELIAELYRIHKAADGEDAYIRIQVSRGEGPISLDPRAARGVNTVIYVKPVPKPNPENYTKGVSVVTTDVLRNSKNAIDPNIKSGNYLNNILAIQKGLATNAAECLMVNREGFITEATTSNIYMVKDGRVYSSPDNFDILWGITRSRVRELARAHNVDWVEKGFTPEELRNADEVFLTSSIREVMPVSHVDGRAIKSCPGSKTQQLLDLYRADLKSYLTQAAQTHPWRDSK